MDIENSFARCPSLSIRSATASSMKDQASSQMTPGRRRTSFSEWQLNVLEERFLRQSYLSREERTQLGSHLNLTERQVMLWFQNRRARLKKQGIRDAAYIFKVRQMPNADQIQEDGRRPHPMLTAILQSSVPSYCQSRPATSTTTFSTIDQQQQQTNSFYQVAPSNYTAFQQTTGFH